MRLLVLAALPFMTLAGCAPARWEPYRATSESADLAFSRCQFEAERAAPTFDMRQSAIATAFSQASIITSCMNAKGYRRT